MQAKIKSLHLENFKGVKSDTYQFDGKNVSVMGANATGKTTIADSLWWLLFNKDSQGNEKFSIRPLDENGKQIDNVEICVSAALMIDGKEMELKKSSEAKLGKKARHIGNCAARKYQFLRGRRLPEIRKGIQRVRCWNIRGRIIQNPYKPILSTKP